MSREIIAFRNRRALEKLRPRYEEVLRRSELLLDAMEEPVAYAMDGVHLHCNRAYAQIFGFEQVEDLQGVPQLDLISADDQDTFKDALRRYRNQPDENISIAITAMRSDGSSFPAELVFSPTSYEGEHCRQVLVHTEFAQQPEAKAVSPGAAALLRAVPGAARPRATTPAAERREVVRVEQAWKEYAMGTRW